MHELSYKFLQVRLVGETSFSNLTLEFLFLINYRSILFPYDLSSRSSLKRRDVNLQTLILRYIKFRWFKFRCWSFYSVLQIKFTAWYYFYYFHTACIFSLLDLINLSAIW